MRAIKMSVVVCATAIAAAGCGREAETAARVEPAPLRDAASVTGVDSFRQADLDFYEAFHYPGTVEAENYESLDDAMRSATAVVLAQVTDVRVSRLVGPAGDQIPYVGVTIRPVEVLRGMLRPTHTSSLTVEFISAAASVDELRASMPSGYAVWVLRNKAEIAPGVVPKAPPRLDELDYYRLVSSQGLFVQGERSVVNPLEHVDGPEIPLPDSTAHGGFRRDPVLVAAEQYQTVSALAAYVRSLG